LQKITTKCKQNTAVKLLLYGGKQSSIGLDPTKIGIRRQKQMSHLQRLNPNS